MKTIYKYPLQLCSEQIIIMPLNAQILSVQWVRGSICIYALVDSESDGEPRRFEIFGTGHPVPPQDVFTERDFLGTVVSNDQELVFHVYERRWL